VLFVDTSRKPALVLSGSRQSRKGGGASPPQEGELRMTTRDSTAFDGRVEFLNPAGLPRNPAFSNVAVVSGNVRTIYIGGQDAVDADGNIVGIGDIAAQTEQVLRNLRTALEAAGARPEHVVKWNVFIVDGQTFAAAYAAFQRVWGDQPNPPVITGAVVKALARAEFLVEMDAIAVVPA
jgi:enamine deaminase RidA (YjgF/YER057c/UK114 family)